MTRPLNHHVRSAKRLHVLLNSLKEGITTIRRHMSYVNVVATFVLVFAMSGGALGLWGSTR
jgi:hypothetical protein